MVQVKRKKGETFESFLRRFNRRLMGSGQLIQARKIRYYKSPETKRARRVSTLRGKKIATKMAYLEKLGRVPEQKKRKRRRR
jgi:small subunit ribosomal protein S21